MAAQPDSSGPSDASTPARRGRWARGPKALMWTGASFIALALVAAILAASNVAALDTWPEVIDDQGNPGQHAIASGPVPGSAEVPPSTGGEYILWWVSPAGHPGTFSPEDVAITDSAGEHAHIPGHRTGMTQSRGEYRAVTIIQYSLESSREYSITVEGEDDPDSSFVLTEVTGGIDGLANLYSAFRWFVLAVASVVLGIILMISASIWGRRTVSGLALEHRG